MVKVKKTKADRSRPKVDAENQSMLISGPATRAGTRLSLHPAPNYSELTPAPSEPEEVDENIQAVEEDEVTGEPPPFVPRPQAVKVRLGTKAERRFDLVELPEVGPIVLPPLSLTLLKKALEFTVPERFPDIEILRWLKSNEVLPIVKQWKTECYSAPSLLELMRQQFQIEYYPWEEGVEKVILAAKSGHFRGFVIHHVNLLAYHATRVVKDNSAWFDQTFLRLELRDDDRLRLAIAVLLSAWQDYETSGDEGFFGILLRTGLADAHYAKYREVLDRFYIVDRSLSLDKEVSMKDCGVQTIEKELAGLALALAPRKVMTAAASRLPQEESKDVTASSSEGGGPANVTQATIVVQPDDVVEEGCFVRQNGGEDTMQIDGIEKSGKEVVKVQDSQASEVLPYRTDMSAQEIQAWFVSASKCAADTQIELLRTALVNTILNGTGAPHPSVQAHVVELNEQIARKDRNIARMRRKLRDRSRRPGGKRNPIVL